MSKKISEMTPTGSAPATSELALAYNGENYKISPANLIVSGGGGGGIQAVKRFKLGYIGNGTTQAAYSSLDGNLTAGTWVGYPVFINQDNPVGPPGTPAYTPPTSNSFYATNSLSQDYLIGLISSGAYRPSRLFGYSYGYWYGPSIQDYGCRDPHPQVDQFVFDGINSVTVNFTYSIGGVDSNGASFAWDMDVTVAANGTVAYFNAPPRGYLSYSMMVFLKVA